VCQERPFFIFNPFFARRNCEKWKGYNAGMNTMIGLARRIGLLGIFVGMSMGCVHQLPAHPTQEALSAPLVFGQIQVWQEKPSGRIFLP